jgi:metal-sulfur cluster biosynthetic enzyme
VTEAGRPTAELIREALREVEDPELGMNILDLGLVYDIAIDDGGVVTVDMTFTSPACPVGPMIEGAVFHTIRWMDGIEDVDVNIVWDPPWDPKTMASEDVKLMLGIW